jgi:hypothetical protein
MSSVQSAAEALDYASQSAAAKFRGLQAQEAALLSTLDDLRSEITKAQRELSDVKAASAAELANVRSNHAVALNELETSANAAISAAKQAAHREAARIFSAALLGLS